MPTQAKEIFEAQSKSLREMLSDNGLGLYLPPYQRPYGWSKVKVEKLLEDTLHGLNNLSKSPDSFTFLGTIITIHDVKHVTVQPIVKSEVPSKVLTVIDGQQRLSSLLLLLVNLHYIIRQNAWKVFKNTPPESSNFERTALYSETLNILQILETAFYEKKNFGDSPIYPRLIRAFVDQWSKNTNLRKYDSPIANFVFNYSVKADEEGLKVRPTEFKPKPRPGAGEGEEDLIKRFNEIRVSLNKLAQNKRVDELEDLPPLSTLASNSDFQHALFNHELEPALCEWMNRLEDEPEAVLMRLVMVAAYVLDRIALTVVQGKDEDYAFTIFESLNTTGEPLTAFETFLPRVVMSEGIQVYQDSAAHEQMKSVQKYLDRFSVGDSLLKATSELLVTFALAETGKKLSKRLSHQRAYMKDTFDRHKESGAQRSFYLRHLNDASVFLGSAWNPKEGEPRQLKGLPANAMTDTVKLCLSFLDDLNHSIAAAPLVRFYSTALHATPGDEQNERIIEFEKAIKAITAFTVFWRSTRRGTGNIDGQYRSIMEGSSLTGVGPLARTYGYQNRISNEPQVDAESLRQELLARLTATDHKFGGIPDLETFLSEASALPFYDISVPLTRFLLLAAYHNTVEDSENPGLIKAGREGVSPCLVSGSWTDETHLTIEHIIPQEGRQPDWSKDFYVNKDLKHSLGNLVLAPKAANSSLGNRPWGEKKVLYAALGAKTKEDAKCILDKSGISLASSTEELAQMSRYLPHLRALGEYGEEWNVNFVHQRTETLLRLAYGQLRDWLGIKWT
jgi:hypothetical protein